MSSLINNLQSKHISKNLLVHEFYLHINILNHINIVHIPTKWFIASPIFGQLPGGNPRTAAIMRRRYEKKGTGWTSRDECARWMFGG